MEREKAIQLASAIGIGITIAILAVLATISFTGCLADTAIDGGAIKLSFTSAVSKNIVPGLSMAIAEYEIAGAGNTLSYEGEF